MELVTTINGQEVVFWRWCGYVDAKQPSALGRIGVNRQWHDVRFRNTRAGSRSRTVALPKSFNLQRDDEVSLLYVRRIDLGKGPLVGIVNHTRRSYLGMPHGHNPFRPKPDPVWGTGMALLKLFGVPGATLLILAATWMFLDTLTDVRFPIPAWLIAWAIGAGAMWVFGIVYEWREEVAERHVELATESLLRAMVREADMGQDAAARTEIRSRTTPSGFLRGESCPR